MENEFIMTDEELEYLKKLAKEIDIELDEIQIKQFSKYYTLLMEKNRVMNLTSITDPKEVIVKHFIDSLSIAKIMNFDETINIIDVGTGAGFPGVPIKIAFPKVNVLLLDSLNKRVNFLNETIAQLGLTNIEAMHVRAEEGAHVEGLRQNFDLCVSRAVANLSTLSEYCMGYVKENGYFISYKSGNVTEELESAKNAIATMNGNVKGISGFYLPQTDIERTLIKIKVEGEIPKRYPRKSGIPSREPIM